MLEGENVLSGKSIENKVENLLEPIINNLGYELYDVIYEKEVKDYYLRIFIDSDKGISIEDCEIVNNAINDLLDEKDYIKEQYFLEVSSPGIERLLRKEKHFLKNIGKKVSLKLYSKIEETGKKEIEGELLEYNEESLVIRNEQGKFEIDKKKYS